MQSRFSRQFCSWSSETTWCQSMEIYCTNQGYAESRKEQARLHEELAQRERVLRESQIRSIHEVGELTRAQEMRIDEFSRNELRESHAPIQELTSQIQELQERMNYLSDSGELQDKEIGMQRKIISRSQSAGSRSKSSIYVEPRPKPAIWYMEFVWDTVRNVFSNPCPPAEIDSSPSPYQRILHSLNQSATSGNTVQKSTGRLVAKIEEKIRGTIPLPSFAREASTINSFFPAEVPHNSMADQQKLQISELHFDKFPHRQRFHVGS